jgi:two-component SAPR family response regulator/Tfp pilus assembly protein PilF
MLVLGRVFREQGRLEEAQRHYEEAEKLFKAQEDSLGLVDVKMNLGALLLFKGACPGAQQALRQASRHCPREGEAKRRGDILKSLGDVLSSQGEHAKAKAYLQKAGAIFESSGNFHDWVEAMSNLATIATFQGEMREASELHRRLIERVETRYWHSVGVLFANAASTALDFGQVEWAEHVLARGLFICRPYEDHRSRATLARVQGFLDIEKGHWVEAELSFHEALEEFKTIRWGLGEPTVLRDLGRLYRYWGRGEKAQDCLDRAREIVGQTASLFQAFLLPEVGLLALARGQLDQAETVFKESLTLSRRYGAKVPEFLTELGYAELSFARGRAVAAQGWFRKAAGRARAKGYDGILRRELRHSPGLAGIARKVAAAARQKELAAYIVKILAQTGVSPDSSEAGYTLRVKLFGSLRLSLAGGKAVPVKWPTRKEASLFAYLLFHRDRVCPREELINVLWPKSKATAAAKTLWASIFRLKRALAAGLRTAGERGLAGKPQIIHQDKGYGIASSLVFEVDVDEFLRERQKAKELEKEGKAKECRGAYRRCAELYQDDFLPNLGEAWVEERREEYEKHYLHVLKVLARDSFLNQDYEEAAHLLRSYLKRDVYSEDVRRELWKAFKALGRVSYIQKNYKELQRILRRDLSQVPTVETEEFYRQLMIS